MRVEELAGTVMYISREDADEDMPEGHYLIIPLPDSLDASAMDASFALKLGNAGVFAHTEAEA